MRTKKPRLVHQNLHKYRNLRRKQNAFQRFNSMVLDFFGGFFYFIANLFKKKNSASNVIYFKRRKSRIPAMFLGTVFIAGILGLIFFLTWFFTNENAYAVYLGEKQIGIINKNENVTGEELQKTVVQKLVAQLGTNIELKEKIKIESVRADGKDIATNDHVIGKIAAEATYKIEAAVITIDGLEMVIVNSATVADEIFKDLQERFIPEGTKLISAKFVQNVKYVLKYVETDQVIKQEVAYAKLSAEKEQERKYIVKEKDILSKIASENDLTLEQIYAVNPDLNPKSIIRPGQEIILMLPEPLISVLTVDEITIPDVAPKPITKRNIPNKPASYIKVIQYGKEGQRNVTLHVERLNGIETGNREEISEEIIVPPVEEIIEVGQA